MNQTPVHDMFTISRTIRAPAEKIFTALEDPAARAKWGPPSDDEAIEFVASDFRPGGMDVHMCGPKGDLRFKVETRYYAIARPNRLVFTEHVLTDGTPLSVSLITANIDGNGTSTQFDLTVQTSSLAGQDMAAGIRGGWQTAIGNLETHLAAAVGSAANP